MNQSAPGSSAFVRAEQIFAQRLGVDLREHYVQLPGPIRRARVLETGVGAPLLFVHGGGGFASQWLPLMAAIDGRRLIAVDRPGCGLSDGFDYDGCPSPRAHAVEFLSGVLDALELARADIVANSMGGLWSLWLALDKPDRVRSLALAGCPALVVGTSTPLLMRVMSRSLTRNLLIKGMERPTTPSQMRRGFKMALGHDTDTMEAASPGVCEFFAASNTIPGAAASFVSLLHRVLRLGGAQPDCALGVDELQSLAVNPLVVWGSSDPFGDASAARRFAAATGARLEFVGVGHLPWLDDPVRVADLITVHLAEHID